jgi:hypothetical protein
MTRARAGALLAALASAATVAPVTACRGRVLTPAEIGECREVDPLALSLPLSRLRVHAAMPLSASGGSGHYKFSVAAGGSGGAVRGDRFIAGPTPATDTIEVEDTLCATRASATVQVIAPFDAAPSRITVPPGASFQIEVTGLFGTAAFTLAQNQSGATLSPAGLYTAGAVNGSDFVNVVDRGTGEQLDVDIRVSSTAQFRAAPASLALPAGAWLTLGTVDGSDRVTWSKERAGDPGTLTGDRFEVSPSESGTVVVVATDRFLNRTARATLRILDELRRPSTPHGRLTDTAVVVAADFDQDGHEDAAVGVPESDLSAPQGGAVFFFRGSPDGFRGEEVAWRLTGTTTTAAFGTALAAGDLDGDGRPELAVGAPGADVTVADSGAVYLYRFGAGGPALLRAPLTGTGGRGRFGSAVQLADMNGDGGLDLVVGSPAADLAVANNVRGVVDVFQWERGAPIPSYAPLRLSGWDLNADGTLASRAQTRAGGSLVAADLNADGRTDLAVLQTVTNSLGTGAPLARSQVAVEVFFGRTPDAATRIALEERPDLMVTPTATTETGFEGPYRLGFIPPENGRPPLLMVIAELADSPDLRSSGGTNRINDSGAAWLFDLTAHQPTGAPGDTPAQVGRPGAWAQLYGDAGAILTGRSFAVADVDGAPGSELLLGAPLGTGPSRLSGRLIIYSLAGLSAGTVRNKPDATAPGLSASETFGAGMGALKDGLLVVAARATTAEGAFTGRLEARRRAGASFDQWTRQTIPFAARAADEQFALTVAGARSATGRATALVGAPGFAGPGALNDGNDLRAGRAYLYDVAAPGTAAVAAEGAASPLIRAGREVGADVAFTDFDGDGRQDLAIGSPNLVIPGTNSRATEITPYYETEVAACLGTGNQTTGGVQVHLGMADGTFRPGYRVWAVPAVPGCTGVNCVRAGIGRMVGGGFDFDGDGRQDLAATRNGGMEIFLGRPPDSAQLTRLTMSCDPVLSATYQQNSFGLATGSPTAIGDLDGDGCEEVAYRVASLALSSFVIAFGFDPGGVRCGGRSVPAYVRVVDREASLVFLGMGVAFARAGRFLDDGRDYLAVSASRYPVGGVPQDAVLLFDVAQLRALRPASGEVMVPAIQGGLTVVPLVPPLRITGFGRALAGNVDVVGDASPDLVVGAPGGSFNSDGAGVVFVYRGGRAPAALEEAVRVVGDPAERSGFGSALALIRAAGSSPPHLVIGAPQSYRTGTNHGTGYALPLGF